MQVVGVTTYYPEVAAWGTWARPAAVVPQTYVETIAAAGGRPVLIPPFRSGAEAPLGGAKETIEAIDALVLVGGGDLDPLTYGQRPHEETSGVTLLRDASEHSLLAAALAADLPTLCICRGHQLLNVHLGGTLTQHLVGVERHRPAPGEFIENAITTVADTKLRAILGSETEVLCSHHQAIGELGEGLIPAAHATRSDLLEGVELPSHTFVVGVQWHPEESGDTRLVEALLRAASGNANG